MNSNIIRIVLFGSGKGFAFNRFDAGQALGFVVSDFASQIAEIEAGKKEPFLSVGDLSTAWDFTYVTDLVKIP